MVAEPVIAGIDEYSAAGRSINQRGRAAHSALLP